MDTLQTSHGIRELIDRLRDEGIDAGRGQAAEMLEQARQEIEVLREAARVEADALAARAKEQARVERESALAAIRLAWQNSLLKLKEEFLLSFGERLRRRVRDELADPGLLKRVIESLLVHPQLVPGASRSQAGLNSADSQLISALDALAAGAISQVLTDGVELASVPGRAGLCLRLTERDLEVHLTDETITALMLEHLLPRVRRYVDGGPAPVIDGLVGAEPGDSQDARRIERDDALPREPQP